LSRPFVTGVFFVTDERRLVRVGRIVDQAADVWRCGGLFKGFGARLCLSIVHLRGEVGPRRINRLPITA